MLAPARPARYRRSDDAARLADRRDHARACRSRTARHDGPGAARAHRPGAEPAVRTTAPTAPADPAPPASGHRRRHRPTVPSTVPPAPATSSVPAD